MAYVFNSTNTGTLTDPIFTRPINTPFASSIDGSTSVAIATTKTASIIGYSGGCASSLVFIPVDSNFDNINIVYFNIAEVPLLTTGTLYVCISSIDGVVDYTRSFDSSKLLKGTFAHNDYWQGFDIGSVNLSAKRYYIGLFSATSSNIKVFCKSPNQNNTCWGTYFYNRFVTSTAFNTHLISYTNPTVYIGNILNSIESGSSSLDSTAIFNSNSDLTTLNGNLTIGSNTIINLTSGRIAIAGNITAKANSTLNVSNTAIVTLSNTSKIIGTDNSKIIFNGLQEKKPYTYLQKDSKLGDDQFVVEDNINTWNINDRILLPPYPTAVAYETLTLSSVNSNTFQTTTPATTLHYSGTAMPYFYFHNISNKYPSTSIESIYDVVGSTLINSNTISSSNTPFETVSKSIYLSGSQTTYLTVPSSTIFFGKDASFTISTWVYLNNNPSVDASIFGDVNITTSNASWNAGIKSDGRIFLKWGTKEVISSDYIEPNSWNHVCFGSNKGDISLYFNGVSNVCTFNELTSAYIDTTPNVLHSQFPIGIQGRNSINGYLYDFHVIKGEFITPIEIYSNTIPTTNTSCLIKCEQISGTQTNLFPVCNLTRSVVVSSSTMNSAYIQVDKACSLTASNAYFLNLGSTVSSTNFGGINLQNNNTLITNSVIQGDGIHIDSLSATNYNINNNIIYNTPRYGIIIKNIPSSLRPHVSYINDNLILRTGYAGLHTLYNNFTYINNNKIINSGADGISINVIDSFNKNQNLSNRVASLSNNTVLNSTRHGIYLLETDGFVQDNTVCFNKQKGLYIDNTSQNIRVIGLTSYNNAFEGAHLHSKNAKGSNLVARDLNTTFNNNGVIFSNIYNTVSGLYSTFNKSTGAYILNCSQQELNLFNFTINNNKYNILYSYPATNFCNFNRTYLTYSNIGSRGDSHGIILDRTNCEKFVVENSTITTINTAVPGVSCIVSPSKIIEGSYIFQGCFFKSIPFPETLNGIYQSDVLNETGFVSMYDSLNPNKHIKQLAYGKIESDTTIYYNTRTKISEKITPTSTQIRMRSGRKILPVRSGTSTALTVYLKKTNWGSNPAPTVIVAANPAAGIFSDRIIGTFSQNTEDWTQISTTTISIPASASNSSLEIYITCSGTSGGSLNIDNWAIAGVIPVSPSNLPPTRTPTISISPTSTPTITPTTTPTPTPSSTEGTVAESPTPTPTTSTTPTPTPTITPTETSTPTPTPTPTVTPSATEPLATGAGIYFYATVSNNWTDLGNWYTTEIRPEVTPGLPASTLPTAASEVVLQAACTVDTDNPNWNNVTKITINGGNLKFIGTGVVTGTINNQASTVYSVEFNGPDWGTVTYNT